MGSVTAMLLFQALNGSSSEGDNFLIGAYLKTFCFKEWSKRRSFFSLRGLNNQRDWVLFGFAQTRAVSFFHYELSESQT